MLNTLNLRQSYRSDQHDIIREFYVPCLSVSTHYRRAVGFFSSTALSVAAKGLHTFLRGGGRMELVASPILSPEDVAAINQGYANRIQVEERALIAALDQEFDRIAKERLGLLAWLISWGRLEVKVAVLREGGQPGVYHEKMGIFSDGQNFVAFTGSPNESAAGLVSNFESIDVYCSWRAEDHHRVREKLLQFDDLWNDRTPLLRVYPFPQAVKHSLLRFRQTTPPIEDPELVDENRIPGSPRVPSDVKLRPYQEQAIESWFRERGRGTLKMATGSGKTIVALALVERLYREIGLQAAIVIVPYRHLVTQWGRESARFGLNPILCFEARREWTRAVQEALFNLRKPARSPFLTVITTNATFRSSSFQGLLPYFPEKTLIIGDEAHNLGTHHLLEALPRGIGLRLALSATPERWFDETGTEELFKYFGPVLEPEFTLRDALNVRALVPYVYRPVFIELTDAEADEYLRLTRTVSKIMPHPDPEGEWSPQLKALLIRRARLLGTAENKLIALRDLMRSRLDTQHTLFYCGDGTVENPVNPKTRRHIEAVCQLLGAELGYRVAPYTAETPLDEREELRNNFISGKIQGLVAIRCLDEGVDIPLVKTAFILASTTNPRQFIQRRGRVLRPYPGKTQAEIFDFIVLPPSDESILEFSVERSILRRELQRYVEFADLAMNAGEARGQLVALQAKYGLLSI